MKSIVSSMSGHRSSVSGQRSSVSSGIEGLKMPTADEIRAAVERELVNAIPWYRERTFNEVTMLEIVRQLVPPPRNDQYLLPGTVTDGLKVKLSARQLSRPHVYVSQHNPGVLENLVSKLEEVTVEVVGAACFAHHRRMRVSDAVASAVRRRASGASDERTPLRDSTLSTLRASKASSSRTWSRRSAIWVRWLRCSRRRGTATPTK